MNNSASVNNLLRSVTKGGRPLLFFPDDSAAAVGTLALYPAQSVKARMSKKILAFWLSLGLPLPRSEAPSLDLEQVQWFENLDCKINGAFSGIFMGNQFAPGARSLHLLFDEEHKPRFLIKFGDSHDAIKKITDEREFLKRSAGTIGIPKLVGEISNGNSQALVLEFFQGTQPSPMPESPQIPGLLSQWIKGDSQRLDSFSQWQEIMRFADIPSAISSREIRPVVSHGDFAPWNILVEKSGRWNAIDWERGREAGVPLWDWFHFAIQPLILVKKSQPQHIVGTLESLRRNPAFKDYMEKTQTAGLFHELLQGYLIFELEVNRPTEGSQHMRELLAFLKSNHTRYS